MSNLLFIDVETTGLSPRKHEIIELAAAVEIDGVTQCEFVLYFRPEKWDTISNQALEKNGWTVERLKRLPEKSLCKEILSNIINSVVRKITSVPGTGFNKLKVVEHSKNGNFDYRFLEAILKTPLAPNFFNWHFLKEPINTRDLVKRRFPREKHYALKDCARLCGIPFDDKRHHGARYDMEIMREIYRRCAK